MYSSPSYIASDILEQFWDLSLPVNPIAIAQKMGISVYYSENKASEYYNTKTKEIFIQEYESSAKQRFAIASKLGYAIFLQDPYKRFLRTRESLQQFVNTLLMPSLALRTMVEQRNMQFSELCSTFDVPEEVMADRLFELKII